MPFRSTFAALCSSFLLLAGSVGGAQTLVPVQDYFPGTIEGFNPVKELDWIVTVEADQTFTLGDENGVWFAGTVERTDEEAACFTPEDLFENPRFCRRLIKTGKEYDWVDLLGRSQGVVFLGNSVKAPQRKRYDLLTFMLNKLPVEHRMFCPHAESELGSCFPLRGSIADKEELIANVQKPLEIERVRFKLHSDGVYRRKFESKFCDLLMLPHLKVQRLGEHFAIWVAETECSQDSFAVSLPVNKSERSLLEARLGRMYSMQLLTNAIRTHESRPGD